MTINEIATTIHGISGMSVDGSQIVAYVNELLFKLGKNADSFSDVYYPASSGTQSVSAASTVSGSTNNNTYYELPTGFIDVYDVYKCTNSAATTYEASSQATCIGYETTPNEIRFFDSGKYRLKFHILPSLATDPTDTPSCSAAFHPAMVYYCLYRMAKDPTDEESLAWLAEANAAISNAIANKMVPTRVKRSIRRVT